MPKQEDDDLEIPNVDTSFGRGQVRALIGAHQAQLETQMKEVEKARQALRAEEKLYSSIQSKLDCLYSSIAPLHRLPYELIGEIASLCVEAGDLPWDLARVCRSWRSACLSTPKLWGGLRILLARKWPRCSPFQDGKENCVTTSQLHRALMRSGATPLHLEFRSWRGKGRCSPQKGTNYCETISHLVDILSYPEHVSRLKTLSIDCDRRWSSYPTLERYLCGPFPSLEHISLTRTSSIKWPAVNVADWAPRVNSAEFRGLWVAGVKPNWVEQLKKLKIDGLQYMWSTTGYHLALAKCQFLTSLSLTKVRSSVYSSGTLNIELLSLVHLEIHHSVVLGRTFVTPALETLIIEKTEWRTSKIQGNPDISHLRNFHWAGFQKDWMLSHVSTPVVGTLAIDLWNGGGWQLLWAWRDDNLEETHCVPQKLFIKHSGDSVPKDNVLENGRFLRVFPNVKEVKIIGIPLGKAVLKELSKEIGPKDREARVFHDRAPRKGEKQPPMCPDAEVLELDMTHVGKKERRGMRTLARAVLKARRLRGLRCLWEKDGEWEEFHEGSMDAID